MIFRESDVAIYGLPYKARSIVAQHSLTEDHSRFLVGTQCLREENEIHLIEIEEEQRDIRCVGVYRHANEVWHMAGSTQDSAVFAVCHFPGRDPTGRMCATVYRLPSDSGADLHALCDIGSPAADTCRVLWSPSEASRVACVEDNALTLWDLQADLSAPTTLARCAAPDPTCSVGAAAWDCHFHHQLISAAGCTVWCWDTRSPSQPTTTIQDNAMLNVRDIDFNPNRPYVFVTGGDDARIRYWDARNSSKPVLEHPSMHAHWVCAVRYNPFYDQLLVTAGTDSQINLWSAGSVSSSSLSGDRRNDKRLKEYDDHEESVYSIAWSSTDAWTFASVSYDGRVVVNLVPQEEKYAILLTGEEDL